MVAWGSVLVTDLRMAEKMDATLVAYWVGYGLADGSQFREYPDAVFSYTPIPLFLFNTVILTGENMSSVDKAAAHAAQNIAESGRPVLWRLGPAAQSDAVRSRLLTAGLHAEGREPAMLMDLSDLRPANPVAGLTIEPVAGRSALRDWAWLTCDAFELDADVREATALCEAKIPPEVYGDQQRYTGFLNGRPVAVSSLVMVGDLAGIYAVATLPEARGLGIGTAMTVHAMLEGKRRGAVAAALQATEMGLPVYERLGFSTVFDYETYLQT
jgi:ribosomal protein S18 acetylase RimI-like enzyme